MVALRRAAPWVNFGGSVGMKASPQDVDEGSLVREMNYARDSTVRICGEISVWSVVGVAGPLRGGGIIALYGEVRDCGL